jgi:site-specific DNA-methyltransferase (adenine-specific)
MLPEYIQISNEDNMELMSRYGDNHFDLAIVDPPYGIGPYWMKQKHTQHYGNANWNEEPPTKEYFLELFRVSKNQIIWGGNYFTDHLPVTNSWIYWDKGSDVLKMNTSEGELAWTSFRTPMRKVFVQWSGACKGVETGIKCIHPCQRPIALHEWILKNYAKPKFKILDTHLGSGSIAVALHKINVIEGMRLSLIACEIYPEYYKKTIQRIKTVVSNQMIDFKNYRNA